jgi:hypothetical protein
MLFLQIYSRRRTGRNTGAQDFSRMRLTHAVHGKLKEGAGGRKREAKKSGKRNLEDYPFPVPGLSRPGALKPEFL